MTVENAPFELLVLVEDPYIRSRSGTPQGARVSIETSTDTLRAMAPDKARELASALMTAADRADEIDAACMPHLHAFTEALRPFQDATEGDA